MDGITALPGCDRFPLVAAVGSLGHRHLGRNAAGQAPRGGSRTAAAEGHHRRLRRRQWKALPDCFQLGAQRLGFSRPIAWCSKTHRPACRPAQRRRRRHADHGCASRPCGDGGTEDCRLPRCGRAAGGRWTAAGRAGSLTAALRNTLVLIRRFYAYLSDSLFAAFVASVISMVGLGALATSSAGTGRTVATSGARVLGFPAKALEDEATVLRIRFQVHGATPFGPRFGRAPP